MAKLVLTSRYDIQRVYNLRVGFRFSVPSCKRLYLSGDW